MGQDLGKWGVLSGLFSCFKKEKERRKAGEQMLLPLPRASRGRRRPIVSFKTALFWLLFFSSG